MKDMLRLRQICLVASELEEAVNDLQAVFGLETCFHDPNVAKYGLKNALNRIRKNNYFQVSKNVFPTFSKKNVKIIKNVYIS